MNPEEIKTEDQKEISKLLTPGVDLREGQRTSNLESSLNREEFNREILKMKDNVTTNFITIFGIFASLLAFLIIEIQVLKTVCDYLRIAGLTLFVLGALFCFITFLIYFIDSQSKKTSQMILLTCISVGLLIGGVYCISHGQDEYVCKLNKLNDDMQSFKNNLQNQQDNWFSQKSLELKKLETSLKQPQ